MTNAQTKKNYMNSLNYNHFLKNNFLVKMENTKVRSNFSPGKDVGQSKLISGTDLCIQ